LEIYFANSGLEGDCGSAEGRTARWGPAANVIARRLAELSALESLADAAYLPGVEIQEVTGGGFQLVDELGLQLVLRYLEDGPSDPIESKRLVVEDVTVIDLAAVAAGDEV
jgi:hypothetical protein